MKLDAESRRIMRALVAHVVDRPSHISEEVFLATVFGKAVTEMQNLGAHIKDAVAHGAAMSLEAQAAQLTPADRAANRLSHAMGAYVPPELR